MTSDTSRRAVLAAVLAAGVGGLATSSVRDLLDSFAPLSGGAWGAADRTLSERVESPYGEATLRIDDEGVPHVEAGDEASAYFAVGYVQAFNRLFQLDLGRRLMRGQLSELVGEPTLASDEFHVAMDFSRAARATWDLVSEGPIGSLVEAYADGINAAIDRESLPLEFELLGYVPREWTPVDSMLLEKQISWELTGNFRALRRSLVADALGEAPAAELFPARMDHEVPIVRESLAGSWADSAVGSASDPPRELTDRSVGAELTGWLSQFESPPGIGSNSWVVSGTHTPSGNPLVANDPHLTLMAPPVWYEQHVETPETSVRGFAFPGIPFVVIGANSHGAWGFTNVGADVLDCYRYDLDDEGERYRYRGQWRSFDTEERVIRVAGGNDRHLTVKTTVHGPLVEREGQRVGVAWTGLTATRTSEAIYALTHSEGVEDVLDTIAAFDAPTQNLTYADDGGRTLYAMTGRVPIRRIDGEAVSGDRLFDGSAGEGEWSGFTPYGESTWEGFVPVEENPRVVDPDYLATANQRILDDPGHYVGVAYAPPYRASRLYDVLDERAESPDPMDHDFHRELQVDIRDERGPQLVPELLAALEDRSVVVAALDSRAVDETDLVRAVETLEAWEYRMARDSRGALLFARWVDHFRRLTLEPAFGEAALDESFYPNDWTIATLPADSAFYDDRSRQATMVHALIETIAEVDDGGWETYGDWNTTGVIEHPFGTEAPFLDYPDLPTDGSRATVNNYDVAGSRGSSLRMLVEVGGEASAIIPGSNDGSYFSSHYDDQLQRWRNGEYKPIDRTVGGDLAVTFERDAR